MKPWELDGEVCPACGAEALPLSVDTGGATYYCTICGTQFTVPAALLDLPIGPTEDKMEENGIAVVRLTPSQMADIEEALRVWIGQLHHDSCTGPRRGVGRRVQEWLDARYEHALDTYRAVVGKEPTAPQVP